MTSEIALLNRTAIALAADSAVTTRYYDWAKGQYETRYFKGANKIFNLSGFHPVGLMVYDSGNIQGVPIEVLVKSYRNDLEQKSHDHLSEYAKDFFEFLSSNANIYPSDYQDNVFQSEVIEAAASIVGAIIQQDGYKNAPPDEQKSLASKKLEEIIAMLKSGTLIKPISPEDVDSTTSKYQPELIKAIEGNNHLSPYIQLMDVALVAAAAIRCVFTREYTSLNTTGIVVAGFGERDFFPRLVSFTCYGIILGKFLHEPESNEVKISHGNVSEIIPFAQDNMVKTFMYGMSIDALTEIDKQYSATCDYLEDELKKAGKLGAGENIEEIKKSARERFGNEVVSHFNATHARPLRQVVGMLPIDELAELAETLISIESMKERVTRPSSSVSGPIDVAVISKGDGFIWVKRKHYFDPKLNPRFFARRSITVTEQ